MKISLLQNAYSFLEEALSKAIKAENEPIHWKFATLNLVQAIELSLKEKLSQEHPVLVFQQIDSPKNTVNKFGHRPKSLTENWGNQILTGRHQRNHQSIQSQK